MHQPILIALCSCGLTLFSWVANATFHLYDITEVYSNADGTIQFVEMSSTFNSQHLFSGHTMTAASNPAVPYPFPNNLPSSLTANTSLLIATARFAALPGAITPDYVMPDNFFVPNADSVTLDGGFFGAFTWTVGQLSTDGVMSLNRSIGGGSTVTEAVNSPTNFAGQTGSIDLSAPDRAQVYVNFSGDNGDGSIATPFNTLAAALDAVADGGTVFIDPGQSSETFVTDGVRRIRIEATAPSVLIGVTVLPAQVYSGFRSR